MVTKIADGKRRGKRVRIGASDLALTRYAGMVAVTDLVARLKVIESIDTAVGPVKKRNRGFGLGQVLVAMAAAQLAGKGFLVGLDRVRTDTAGQELVPVAGVATSTGCEIVKRVQQDQWLALASGIGAVYQRMLELVPGARWDALCAAARGRYRRHRCAGLRPGQAWRGLQLPGSAVRAPERGQLGAGRGGAGR